MNDERVREVLRSGLRTPSYAHNQALDIVHRDPAPLIEQCRILEEKLKRGRRWLWALTIVGFLLGGCCFFFGNDSLSLVIFTALPAIGGRSWESNVENNLFIFRVLISMYSAEEVKKAA